MGGIDEGLKAQIEKLVDENKKGHAGIWLEVAEVQFADGGLKVQVKGDTAHPKPVWWPVKKDAFEKGGESYDAYRAILREIDRKRAVLVRLTWDPDDHRLHCDALRFQSAELGSR
jgi:hypothetical protein